MVAFPERVDAVRLHKPVWPSGELIAEILPERLRGEQVHGSAERFRKLILDLDELEQADFTMSSVYDPHRRLVNSVRRVDWAGYRATIRAQGRGIAGGGGV